jgi:hypothetical protein
MAGLEDIEYRGYLIGLDVVRTTETKSWKAQAAILSQSDNPGCATFSQFPVAVTLQRGRSSRLHH